MNAVLWPAAAILATCLLLLVRNVITDTHVALTYLLIVMGATARAGRRLGMVLALACFVAFNYFFLHPYYTLAIRSPLDWLILVAFLATSALGAPVANAQGTGTITGRVTDAAGSTAAANNDTMSALPDTRSRREPRERARS